jgi:osmotically-inducible protein OsmY
LATVLTSAFTARTFRAAPRRKEQSVLTDEVLSSLTLDPRIPDPVEIAVSDEGGGTVTLRGTVGSFAQRRAAVQDTRKVAGVFEVDDEINVRLLDRREDDEIRGVALQSLSWDAEVPAASVDAKVEEGWLTLKGTVDFQFQSDAAFDDVASLYGVVGVTNEIKVITP